MKKKPRIDVSRIRVAVTDTDDDIMIKIRQALPTLLQEYARQIAEAQWNAMNRRVSHTDIKSHRGERAKFIRDNATEWLQELTPAKKQEAALLICKELKERRDALTPK